MGVWSARSSSAFMALHVTGWCRDGAACRAVPGVRRRSGGAGPAARLRPAGRRTSYDPPASAGRTGRRYEGIQAGPVRGVVRPTTDWKRAQKSEYCVHKHGPWYGRSGGNSVRTYIWFAAVAALFILPANGLALTVNQASLSGG